MIDVTNGLRTELDKPFRNGIGCEVVISTIDKASGFNVFPDMNSGSRLDDICDSTGVSYVYEPSQLDTYKGFASFENNSYNTNVPKRLYRKKRTDEDEYSYYDIYNSRIISYSYYTSPTTEENPFFEKSANLDFEKIPGITIRFGEDETIFPTSIVLLFYDYNGNEIKKVYANPTGINYSSEFAVNNAKKFTIKVLEMNRPNVKLRISSILFGVEKTFKNELISVSVNRASNPLTTELPRNEISVQLFDLEAIFDPQNPEGIYFSLNGGEIRLYYTYGTERNLIGTYTIEGSPTRSGNQVTFKGTSNFFNAVNSVETKLKGYTGISLYDLITDASSYSGFSEFNFETNIDSYNKARDYSYLTEESRSDVLCKVANCIFGIFKEDRYGKVILSATQEPNTYPKTIKYLDESMICGGIDLDTTISVPGGISVKMYSPGTGDEADTKTDGEGNLFTVDNNYMIGDDMFEYMKNSFNWWVKGTQKYTIPYLADPTIEVGDFVSFVTKYKKRIYGIVAENNYNYPASPGSDNLVVYSITNFQQEV